MHFFDIRAPQPVRITVALPSRADVDLLPRMAAPLRVSVYLRPWSMTDANGHRGVQIISRPWATYGPYVRGIYRMYRVQYRPIAAIVFIHQGCRATHG